MCRCHAEELKMVKKKIENGDVVVQRFEGVFEPRVPVTFVLVT